MMKILLQFPEGLKQKAVEIAKKYEKKGDVVFLSAAPCYGACDLALDEARAIGAKKIIHFGHSPFGNLKPKGSVKVEYINYAIDIDIEGLYAVLPYIEKYEKIALATTIQHIHQFEEMKKFFEKHGKKVFAGKGERASKIGQILGCDGRAVKKVEMKIDAVVFVGSGMFHQLAVDIGPSNAQKPVFVYDPSGKTVQDIRPVIERIKKLRKGAIAAALEAKSFGILLSTKPGQFGLRAAEWAKKELNKRSFDASILVANELQPMAVKNFMNFDCYINTACPRMADDREVFGKPVLNIDMLKEVFKLLDQKE